MMGRQTTDQGRLFYQFRLEDRIPDNHLLRRINGFVQVALADLHDEVEPFYSHTGRPSIDPKLMIRMLIADVEATPAKTYDEVVSTKVMIERTDRCFGLKPDRLAADSAYGTGKFLAWLVDKDITPHVTVRDLSKRKDGTFSRADFAYDKAKDICICPAGKTLKTTGRLHSDNTYRYLASTLDCGQCPLKQKCCANMSARRVPRDVNEAARDLARSFVDAPGFQRSSDERKKVEMRFAHLKTHHRFERMRLRGLSGARDEFHLAAIVQNLKTMALRLTRPPAMAPAA